MILGVPKESFPGERRVALVPGALPALKNKEIEIQIEAGAGQLAGYPDSAYEEKGARLLTSRSELFSSSDVVVQIRTAGANPEAGGVDLSLLRPDQILIGFAEPLTMGETMKAMAECRVTCFALELLPRISRAQSMDALSSMATVSGYKAVLLAADTFSRLFPNT